MNTNHTTPTMTRISCPKHTSLLLPFLNPKHPLSKPRISHSHFSTATNHYASLLRQCTSTTQTSAAHLHMIKSGFPYLTLGNKLVDSHCKFGSLDLARKVFDEMPKPHIVSWNNLISSYIRHKRCEEAIGLYEDMLGNGVVPDVYTFSSVFRAFASVGLVDGGRVAHQRVLVLGVDSSNAFVGTALLDMYVKFGKLDEARVVFEQVVDKDVVSFTAMITGYTRNCEYEKTLLIYRDMVLKWGIRGNEFTFASVLIACGGAKELNVGLQIHSVILKSGFESKIEAQTSLLIMYSKCHLGDESVRIFNHMEPNAVTWTALVGCLVENHREEHALSVFRDMICATIEPNEFTLSTILHGCAVLSLFVPGKQIHAYAIKISMDGDRFVGAALIDMYGKCGNIRLARLVYDSLKSLDVVSITSMINGYAQNGDGREAIRLFDQMQSSGFEPSEATFTSVLSACSNSGLLEEGKRIFSHITRYHKTGPSRDHYACFVDILARGGRLKEAEAVITSQIKRPDAVVWRSFLSACKIHGSVEMAERAAGRLLELDPTDDATYMLLSNIYASSGRWNDVIRMKKTLRQMKLKKDPAMSWVEVNRKTHCFMAGDITHPMAEEINRELERLIEETKRLGYVPDTRFVLQYLDELEREKSLYYHSEKLAIAFAVLSSKPNDMSDIMIFKNLRVCVDCHSWIKLVSKVVGREIIARDAKRFHHFKDGICSCGEYW